MNRVHICCFIPPVPLTAGAESDPPRILEFNSVLKHGRQEPRYLNHRRVLCLGHHSMELVWVLSKHPSRGTHPKTYKGNSWLLSCKAEHPPLCANYLYLYLQRLTELWPNTGLLKTCEVSNWYGPQICPLLHRLGVIQMSSFLKAFLTHNICYCSYSYVALHLLSSTYHLWHYFFFHLFFYHLWL